MAQTNNLTQRVEEGVFKVVFPTLIDETFWSVEFGSIQKKVKMPFLGESFNKVVFDISSSTWIGALPMCSICLTLAEYAASHNEAEALLILPLEEDSQAEKRRSLKFLAVHGFLRELLEHQVRLLCGGRELQLGDMKRLNKIQADLLMEQSLLLPFKLMDLSKFEANNDPKPHSKETDIENRLDGWMREMDPVFSSLFGPAERGGIAYRLRVFLKESIDNVWNHAYPRSEAKFCALFLRYRHASPKHELTKFGWQHPVSSLEYERDKKRFLEVFLIDAGVGLYETLKSHLTTTKNQPPKYLFRFLLEKVFQEGIRTETKDSQNTKDIKSKFGGLYNCYRLFSSAGDFIIAHGDGTWFGQDTRNTENYSHQYRLSSDGTGGSDPVQGLYWNVKIAENAFTDTEPNWIKGDSENAEHPYLKILKEDWREKNEKLLGSVAIEDHRFKKSPIRKQNKKGMLFFTSKGLVKNQIRSLIGGFCLSHNPQVLFVLDIPSVEALTYSIAVIGPSFGGRLQTIVLISQSLKVCVLKQNEDRFDYAPDLNPSFFSYEKSQDFLNNDLVFNFQEILRLIKIHDSRFFWGKIKEINKERKLFYNTTIEWYSTEGKTFNLDGYLDFAQTLIHPDFRKLYLISLSRLSGIFTQRDLELHPLDYSVNTLCEKINNTANSKNRKKLNIGSVIISGSSMQNAGNEEEPKFHFFHRKKYSENLIEAFFFFWPQKEFFLGEQAFLEEATYKRVNLTAAIAEQGRDEFVIPRINPGGEYLYYRTPKETYQDLSSFPHGFKTGHWKFGSKHDLQTVNLDNVLNQAFLGESPLTSFILEAFCDALNLKKEDLSEEGKFFSTLEKIISEKESSDSEKKTSANEPKCESRQSILVYLPNSRVNFVIERFTKNVVPEVAQRLFPVPIVKKNLAGSVYFSPLALNAIKNFMRNEKSEEWRCSIFDDALMTGRTVNELKVSLINMGIRDIHTITIFDRRRTLDYSFSKNHLRAFWRLDLPYLGSESYCPLCRAIEIANNFKSDLKAGFLRERIEQWQEDWKERLITSDWNFHGLTPQAVDLKKDRPLGLAKEQLSDSSAQSIDDGQKVTIKNSATLSLYNLETLSMTHREDWIPSLTEEENIALSEETLIEAYAAQLLLFGNYGEKKLTVKFLKALTDLVIESFKKRPIQDKYTSLAVLTLFSFKKSIQVQVAATLLANPSFKPEKCPNDLFIFLCFVLHHNPEKVWDTQLDLSPFKSTLVKVAVNLFDLYTDFLLAFYGSSGIAHSAGLPYFLANYQFSTSYAIAELEKCLVFYERFFTEVESLKERIFSDIPEFEKQKKLVEESLGKIKARTVEYRRLASEESDQVANEYLDQDKNLFEECGQLKSHILRFQKELVLELDIRIEEEEGGENRSFLSETLASLITGIENWKGLAEEKYKEKHKEKHNTKKFFFQRPSILFGGQRIIKSEEKTKSVTQFIAFDAQIKKTLKELFANAIYSHGETRNRFNPTGNSETADVWYYIEYHQDRVEIKIENLYNPAFLEKAEELERLSRDKRHWVHLEQDCKGKVRYTIFEKQREAGDEFYFQTTLILPYLTAKNKNPKN